jgi:hypothetical protein
VVTKQEKTPVNKEDTISERNFLTTIFFPQGEQAGEIKNGPKDIEYRKMVSYESKTQDWIIIRADNGNRRTS